MADLVPSQGSDNLICLQNLWSESIPFITDAAQTVSFNYNYARSIVKAYNQDGADGVLNRRKDSRPRQPQSKFKNN